MSYVRKRKKQSVGAVTFARSVIHWRSKKRIYPKTAKAFPLLWRKKRSKRWRQLELPFPPMGPIEPSPTLPPEGTETVPPVEAQPGGKPNRVKRAAADAGAAPKRPKLKTPRK